YFKEGLSRPKAEAIFGKLQEHHDALRMVFVREGEQWYTESLPVTGMALHVEEHEAGNEQDAAEEAQYNAMQSGMNLFAGPLMKVGLFHTREGGTRVLVVIHHLVVDGVSWRILFEDIELLLGQLNRGEALQLPLKTDSFRLWGSRMEAYRNSAAFTNALPYWNALDQGSIASFRRDDPKGKHILGQNKEVRFELGEALTQRLLTEVHHAFNTGINDILLAALLWSVHEHFGKRAVAVDLEGHGREEIHEPANISRTVGWFTNIYSVILKSPCKNKAQTIREVKDTLARIPARGMGYLLQRQMAQASGNGAAIPGSKIFFNYLGQFDADSSNKSFRIDYQGTGNNIAPGENYPYDWDILGILAGGKLHMRLLYSTGQYHAENIEGFMQTFERELTGFINFCAEQQTTLLSPTDLLYKDVRIEQLDEWQKRFPVENVGILSPLQEGMLFHHLQHPGAESYFMQMSYRLRGSLNMPAVEKSLAALVNRYDVLRTVFIHDGLDWPVQLFLKHRAARFMFKDVRNECVQETAEAIVLKYQEADKQDRFNLSADMLFRLMVLQTGDNEYTFTWTYHHIILDGWCLGLIVQDFKVLYTRFTHGHAPELPPVRPYAHYVAWLQNQDRALSLRFWKTYLHGFDTPTGLPKKDWTSAKANAYQHASAGFTLNIAETTQLAEYCSSLRITPSTLFHAAWAILLGAYNNTGDVLFGTVVSGRPPEMEGVETMVGLFINTVPVRMHMEPGDEVAELLQRIQQSTLEAAPHQYNRLSDIQAQSALKRELIDHIMVMENFPVADRVEQEGPGTDGFVVSDVRVLDRNNYDFSLVVVPGNETRVLFEYNSERYHNRVMESAARHMQHVLQQIIHSRAGLLSDIRIVTPEEERELLQETTDAGNGLFEPLIDLFGKQVQQHPNREALVLGGRSVTYSELNRLASGICRNILAITAGIEQPVVGLYFLPSVEMIAAILAVLKAGGIYVPLQLKDPPERSRYVLANSGAQLLLVQQKIIEETPGFSFSSETIPLLPVSGNEYLPEGEQLPAITVAPNDLINIIYTSGTSGKAKGVEVPQQGIANYICWRIKEYGFTEHDRILQLLSYAFDAFGANFYSALCSGATLVMMDEKEITQADAIARMIEKEKITSTGITPSLFDLVLAESEGTDMLNSLRLVAMGGEQLRHELVKRMVAQCPQVSIYNEYGPTEASITTTCYTVYKPGTPLPAGFEQQAIPIGRPIPGVQVYITDKYGRLQPRGIAGELCIGGTGLARGYLNDPELTARKFIQNPGTAHRKMYRTGDWALLQPDGCIQFLGRADTQVKIRGYRIETTEIEQALDSCTAVKQSVVTVWEHHNDKHLVAYYASENELPVQELVQHLRGKLPDYMIPAHFKWLAELPLNANGKIDMKQLPAITGEQAAAIVLPVNEAERVLHAIWVEILELEPGTLGTAQNFFEIGGHSLKAVQLIGRIKKYFGVELKLEDVFEKETIRNLADYLLTITQLGADNTANNGVKRIAIEL
ncbi:MAG: amino acid adenylation domain-containing protein, partial [Dinghuibacter sp.]|nr:amino acid adenylation domain-containing protein [Dinghuibacter sp.]